MPAGSMAPCIASSHIGSQVFYYVARKFDLETALRVFRPNALKCQKPEPKSTVAGSEEDFDLFGEETPEERAAQDAVVAAQKAKKESEVTKKTKKPVINKSTLVIEVKPNDISTNLDEIERHVRAIKMDGLEWSAASKKVPVAFGLQKLQVGCVIVDDLVDTEDIIENIECIGLTQDQTERYKRSRDCGGSVSENEDEEEPCGMVQSANIVSFQKL